jgi:hypothetical protein
MGGKLTHVPDYRALVAEYTSFFFFFLTQTVLLGTATIQQF